MLIAALFTIAKSENNQNVVFNRRIDKQNVVYAYTGMSFGLKNKVILTPTTTQLNPESIILHETSQSPKCIHSMIPLT